jgi:predicted enzyme related to lactoylglutathione lyase
MARTRTDRKGAPALDMKLEMVPIPVSDVDRALAFYAGQLGFTKDVDVRPAAGVRVVQVTPSGSSCSIGFGTGLAVYEGEPGSARGLHLVVEDIAAARADLIRRGVDVSDVHDFGGGVKGADFADPDGNSFELQELAWRNGKTF